MDSEAGAGGGGRGGRKKDGSRRGNGGASRSSTSSKKATFEVAAASSNECPTPVEQRLSALQLLLSEQKKKRPRSSSSHSPLPGHLITKNGSPPSKLKRLQKKPVLEVKTPKNIRGPNPVPSVSRKGGMVQVRQNPVFSLDMPDLNRLSAPALPTSDQIKEEMVTPPPPRPRPLNKQGPYPSTKPDEYSFKKYLVQRHPQNARAYYGIGVGGGDLHVPVPVPHPRQRDMVLSTFSDDCNVLSPQFQSSFRTVPASISALSSQAKRMSLNPNQLVCLEVPASSVHIVPQKDESNVERMLSQEEEEAKRKEKEKRRVAMVTSERLKNILRMPKAHKWVIYEWFYSDIDRALFDGDNDFETCLRECFPTLKVRHMSRVEWGKIRRMMGKPRRCSLQFFEEERKHLADRREKLRMIQRSVKVANWGNLRFLPEEIPMMLTIGTSVTARVRNPLDGIFQGTVEGVDPSNHTYRITFLRDGLGSHSIPDYEVRANRHPETISRTRFFMKFPRRGSGQEAFELKFRNAALIQKEMAEGLPKSPFPIDSMLGGFPLRCLELIVRQSKLLKAKRSKIAELSELNAEGEKMKAYGKAFPEDYRKRYAICIGELERINECLEKAMRVIKVYVEEISDGTVQDVKGSSSGSSSSGKMVYPEKVEENADKEAKNIVSTSNLPGRVVSGKITDMIQNLASLMLQAKTLGSVNGERKPFELQSMRETLGKTKKSLQSENLMTFQNTVEIPFSRIMAGLCVNPKEDKVN